MATLHKIANNMTMEFHRTPP